VSQIKLQNLQKHNKKGQPVDTRDKKESVPESHAPSQLDSVNGEPKSLPWARLVFIASALALPAAYLLIASLSGENHFGQGLEGSRYWGVFWAAQAASFIGLTFSPCLYPQSDTRQGLLMVLGLIVFLLDNFFCSVFIVVFGRFPD
jgi:hypothetical protein